MRLRQRSLELGGSRYVVREDSDGARGGSGSLQRLLADGTPGPTVGRIDADGCVTLDEAAWAGEWVGELLTATLPRAHRLVDMDVPDGAEAADALPRARRHGAASASFRTLPTVPTAVREAVERGGAAEWRGCLEDDLLALCRAEVRRLDAEGLIGRENHAQQATTRGDRVAYLDLSRCGSDSCNGTAFAHKGRPREDGIREDAEHDAEEEEGDGGGGALACLDADEEEHEACPPSLRCVFDLLEQLGTQLQGALGCGTLLTPRLGMVAVYDGKQGYVRHLDNERHRTTGQASGYRNFRVLTAIAYLNEPGWSEADGGQLRCYAPRGGSAIPSDEGVSLEVLPRGGSVVVFPSCSVPHEVLPSRKPRLAATLWFVSSSLLQPDAPPDAAEDGTGGASQAGSPRAQATGGGGSSSFTATWSCQGDTRTLFGDESTTTVGTAVSTGSEAPKSSAFSFGFGA